MSDLPNLQTLFTARTFRIPEYQRGYSWVKAQWQDLLDDLDELRDDREHFTGTVVLQVSGRLGGDVRGVAAA